MAHQVIWTKLILQTFIQQANLTKEQQMIMRTRAAGWTRVKQSLEFNMSLATIDRIIARLKKKYDDVQKYNPLLPPRKFSVQQLYMDTCE